jgi:hypothetical protein
MNFIRAFFTLTATALLSATIQAAPKPLRLFEIFVERIIDHQGTPIVDRGLLSALGEFKHDIYAQLPPGTTVPPEMMKQNLLRFQIWFGYDALGSEALANFNIGNGVQIAGESYFVVTVADAPKLDIGDMTNISTRATVTPGADPVIGGFIIDGSPRRVLIRGIGPSLGRFAVTAPLADPVITLYKQGTDQPVASNDDWGQSPDADAIEAAAIATGAFVLSRTSKDAACLIELQPGAYTVHLRSNSETGGTALLEVYAVP